MALMKVISHLWLLAYVCGSKVEVVEKVPVKILAPVHLIKSQDHVVPFQAFSELVLQISLQNLTNSCDQLEGACDAFPELRHELMEIKYYSDVAASDLKRGKRALPLIPIAIGMVAGVGLSSLSQRLFGNDAEFFENFRQVRASLAEQHQNIMLASKTLDDMVNHVSRTDEIVEKALVNITTNTESIRLLYELLRGHIISDTLRVAEVQCQRKVFPTGLISGSQFSQELVKHSALLQASGRKLAIPVTRLGDYLTLPLVDCVFTEEHVNVIVKVPIQEASTSWEVFSIRHQSFAYQGKICELDGFESDLILRSSSGTITPIKTHQKPGCNLDISPLCMVPEFPKFDPNVKCIEGLFVGLPFEEVRKSCKFVCKDVSELIIEELPPNVLVLTNLDKLVVKCNAQQKIYKFDRVGTVQWERTCGCTAIANAVVNISEPIICWKGGPVGGNVFHIIPSLWSNITAVTEKLDSIYHSVEEVMNRNWPQSVKAVMLHWHDYENNITTNGIPSSTWSIGITIAVMCLVILTLYLLKRLFC